MIENNLSILLSAIKEEENKINEIIEFPLSQNNQEEKEEIDSKLYNMLSSDEEWIKLTNFSEFEVLHIWRKIEPFIPMFRKRGPFPKITMLMPLFFY